LKGLTKRQRDVLNFINAYISKYGFSPSIRDIAREFRITPRGASIHLIALEKKGYITRSKKARSVRVVNRIEGIKLPLVGTIAAYNRQRLSCYKKTKHSFQWGHCGCTRGQCRCNLEKILREI